MPSNLTWGLLQNNHGFDAPTRQSLGSLISLQHQRLSWSENSMIGTTLTKEWMAPKLLVVAFSLSRIFWSLMLSAGRGGIGSLRNWPPAAIEPAPLLRQGRRNRWGRTFPPTLAEIDKINNIAMYNLINWKYGQMVFQSARWPCSRALFGREKLAASSNQTRAACKAGPSEAVWWTLLQILAEIKAKFIPLNCLLSVILVVKFWGLE